MWATLYLPWWGGQNHRKAQHKYVYRLQDLYKPRQPYTAHSFLSPEQGTEDRMMDVEYSSTAYYDYYDQNNETDHDCPPQDSAHARWVLPMLYLVFFVLGFIGNVMVIAVLSRRNARRADTFILNLAVSDLLFVLTLPLWATSLALSGFWPFGVHICRASGFLIAVTRCASSMLMAIMSVDRYLAVKKGQKVHLLRSPTCSFGTCCTVWAFSFVSGIPAIFSRRIDNRNLTCMESSASPISTALKAANIMVTFALPFSVVVFCYCSMAKHLWKYFGDQKNVFSGTTKRRYGHSWLRIVSCVVAAYCLSWFPFNTLSIVTVVAQLGPALPCHTLDAIRQAISAAAALAFANSCTNPLIYALLDAGFRRRAKQAIPWLLCVCCPLKLLSFRGWSFSGSPGSTESTSTYTDSAVRQPVK
ncbi:probable G-protein coupled receptor 25 [Spea bombifrons]|uniref:probable G-protein coupled receptor 25 n=1 Tax=Spea bombifrons TaxID=233779 RepID=UPI00234A47EB|nr:probable G-protein coupled receptor 25 [Spea bombifrons]